MINQEQDPANIKGGKESKAGMFEDDDEDVPVVKEISYLPSPDKKDKKLKKELKKKK